VIEPMLDDMTERHLEEQKEWLRREPANPRPWYHAAQIYRTQGKRQEALGMLLEAVRLDSEFAAAHLSLAEIYAVQADYPAAWRHARAAERAGDTQGVDLLQRHGIAEQPSGRGSFHEG
jgi:cytochrome c-type biogenesis protein CcmH/NrfG